MSGDRFKNAIASGRPRVPRVGLVTSVTLADSVCMVLVNEGEVPAFLTDQVWDFVEVGAVVTILPVGDTYQVIATQGSSAGAGGMLLGPELIPNGGFEYGVGASPDHWGAWPWVNGDATSARDTTPGESVSGSARMLVSLNPGTSNPQYNVWSEAVSVDAGAEYQASAWLKASVLEATLVTDLYVIAGAGASETHPFSSGTVLSAASVATPGAAYQFLPGPVTIPTGATHARLFLRATADAATAPLTVSWDEASLRQRIN